MCTMFHPRAIYTLSVLVSERLLPYFLKLLYILLCIYIYIFYIYRYIFISVFKWFVRTWVLASEVHPRWNKNVICMAWCVLRFYQYSKITRDLLNVRYERKHKFHNDEKNQLDATSVIYSHKLTLHVSSIYMLIFRSTGCNLPHLVFRTVKENKVLVIGLCCSVCRVVIGVVEI
jgi:hypothetical protein